MIPHCLIRVKITHPETAESLTKKAKAIFQSYSEYTIVGIGWAEIVENEYVVLKIYYE